MIKKKHKLIIKTERPVVLKEYLKTTDEIKKQYPYYEITVEVRDV